MTRQKTFRKPTIGFRLPEDLLAELMDRARESERTLSGEIRLALRRHLEAEDEECEQRDSD